MNIYVDGMFFRMSGIGRIYENVLKALLEEETFGTVSTIVPKSREVAFLETFSSRKLDVRFVPYEQGSMEDYTTKTLQIGRFKSNPGLFYFPNFYFPANLRGNVIVNINDLIPLYSFFDIPKWKKALIRSLISRSLKKSRYCICISECTRNELLEIFHCHEDKLEVIYPWLDSRYQDKGIMNETGKKKPLIGGRYLLFVGNRFAHKNLGALVRAYHALIDEFPDLRLVIAGARMRASDDADRAIEELRLGNKVVQWECPRDDEVMNLYRNCAVFVFPSLAEGFGLPPLEAMASSVPVVCSDIPVLREVMGDAASFADPRDPSSFSSGIRRILMERDSAKSLIEKGIGRVAKYERRNSIELYMRLFKKAMT